MKIKHTFTIKNIFTKEAEQLIESEIKVISEELRQAAIDEAFQIRGEPVEVTASDVRRVRNRLIWQRAPLKPGTDLILKIYMFIGATLFLVGFLYPYIRQLMAETGSMTKFFVSMGLFGLIITVVSLLARYFLNSMHKIKMGKTRLEYFETKEEQ
jgi:hypothetical protein